jgi:hypothetical protein
MYKYAKADPVNSWSESELQDLLWDHIPVSGSVREPEADLRVRRCHHMGREGPSCRRPWAQTHTELTLRIHLTRGRLHVLPHIHPHTIPTVHFYHNVHPDTYLLLFGIHQAENRRAFVASKVENRRSRMMVEGINMHVIHSF